VERNSRELIAGTGVRRRNNVSVTGPRDGRPLVFAHGFGCDQGVWRRVAPAFTDRYRTVLFDHVGAGGSDLSAYDWVKYDSLDGYAEDLVEVCDELDLRDAVVIAHSVSAMIAVLAAPLAQERIGGLVLIGASPRYLDDADTGYLGGFSQGDVDDMLATLSSDYLGWSAAMAPVIMGTPDRPEYGRELTESFCRTDPTIGEQFFTVTLLSDNRRDLAEVAVPTLVVQSAEDAIAPAAVGEYVHRSVAGSELVTLDAVGHCPHLSAPEATIAAIERFLGRS
jgi:sigma-B regulation protein RsbQ